ncbi:hypothetical protein M5C97_23880 [Acidovorax sp. NCPPB 3859]|nr:MULTISPECIES: hypothetical protein [unclassified Acidovorax]MDA8451636.1 hypothetical protein [Acidovorax sp. GBBC 3297]MDA8461082.1 hypothetical protein [Acidovorax sp. GBBC 3333]MDA8466116.1 hypothetical protein [Acidovorax sp. GBBC 3332]MDA8471152.1 hypothetical protein [Acidovorax sp. GBBC 3299]WCM78486.1 hypothetical protein M5C94_23830 [Acidovorax sp. GBBC 712]
MKSVTRLFNQGAQIVQGGFSQLSARARGYTKLPSSGKQHAQPEGLSARHNSSQSASMAPRNAARPGSAGYVAPQGQAHAQPMRHGAASRPQGATPPPMRQAPHAFGTSLHPMAAQHFQPPPQKTPAAGTTPARMQRMPGPATHEAAARPPVGLQHVAAMAAEPAATPLSARARPSASGVRAERHGGAALHRHAVPAASPGRTQQSHAAQVAEAAKALQERLNASSRKINDLVMLSGEAEEAGDYKTADAAEDAIEALKQEREPIILMNNILSGADRGGARQMQALRGFSGAPAPVDPRSLRHAGELRLQAPALRSNAAALRRAQAQFGPVRDLAGKAETLRTALKQHQLPPAARQELEAVLRGFENYAALDAMVRDADRSIRRMGGMGLMDGIPTTAAERRAADDAERRAAQEALDNGY